MSPSPPRPAQSAVPRPALVHSNNEKHHYGPLVNKDQLRAQRRVPAAAAPAVDAMHGSRTLNAADPIPPRAGKKLSLVTSCLEKDWGVVPFMPAHVAVITAFPMSQRAQLLAPLNAANDVASSYGGQDLHVWVAERQNVQLQKEEGEARGRVAISQRAKYLKQWMAFATVINAKSEAFGRAEVVLGENETFAYAVLRGARISRVCLYLTWKTERKVRRHVWECLVRNAADHKEAKDDRRTREQMKAQRSSDEAGSLEALSARKLRVKQLCLEESDDRAALEEVRRKEWAKLLKTLSPQMDYVKDLEHEGCPIERLIANERFDAGRILHVETTQRHSLGRLMARKRDRLAQAFCGLADLTTRHTARVLGTYYRRLRMYCTRTRGVRTLAGMSGRELVRSRYMLLFLRVQEKRRRKADHRTQLVARLETMSQKQLISRYLQKWDKFEYQACVLRKIREVERDAVFAVARRYFRVFIKKAHVAKQIGLMEHSSVQAVMRRYYHKLRIARAVLWSRMRPIEKQRAVLRLLAKPLFAQWYFCLRQYGLLKRTQHTVRSAYYVKWTQRRKQTHDCNTLAASQVHLRLRFHTLCAFVTRRRRLAASTQALSAVSTQAHLQHAFLRFRITVRNTIKARAAKKLLDTRKAFLQQMVETSNYGTYRAVWSRLLLLVVDRKLKERSQSLHRKSETYVTSPAFLVQRTHNCRSHVRIRFRHWLNWCICQLLAPEGDMESCILGSQSSRSWLDERETASVDSQSQVEE